MTTKPSTDDPLLDCLNIICQIHHVRFSKNAALVGLPLKEGNLTAAIFPQAAKRLGIDAILDKQHLEDILELECPLVLILKNNQACVIKAVVDEEHIEVIYASDLSTVKTIKHFDLAQQYSGFFLTTKPLSAHDARVVTAAEKPNRWFWTVIGSYRRIYGNIIVVSIFSNLSVLIIPLFIMAVYDRVVPNQAFTTLWVLAIGAGIFFIFDFIARMVRSYLINIAGSRANMILASRLFKQVLGINLKDRPESAGVISSYFSEFDRVRTFFTSLALVGAIDLPFIILFLIAIWWIGGPVVLIPLVGILLTLAFSVLFEKLVRLKTHKAVEGSDIKNAILTESMIGIESIKSLSLESTMQRKWENCLTETTIAEKISSYYSALASNISVLIQQLVIVSIVVYGVFLITQNMMTIGGLIAITIIGSRALSLGQITTLLNQIERSRSGLNRINLLMGLQIDRPSDKKFVSYPTIKGNIHFEKASFYYPNSTAAAIDDLSLSIKAGERVGIIGRIGSGKSTLLKLISGLFQPTFGSIRIDNIDNREIDPYDLRRQVQYVFHDGSLFFGSVRDNLLLAKPDVSDEDLIKMAHVCGIDKIIQANPLGFDMPVGERGMMLSVGQRNAIMLCRAMLLNPPVLLLDDPTGTIDNEFEKELIFQLPKQLEGKTLILVTHRASMLALVDRLIVVDKGCVIADGPKNQILEQMQWQKSKT